MNWISLSNEENLDQVMQMSEEAPVIIFKHSTRCATSALVFNRIGRSWNEGEMNNLVPFFLDIITFRNLSNKLSQELKVVHQSPQILIIKNRACIFHSSHLAINYYEIREVVNDISLHNE